MRGVDAAGDERGETVARRLGKTKSTSLIFNPAEARNAFI